MSAQLNPEELDTWLDELYGVTEDDVEASDGPKFSPAPGDWRFKGQCRTADTDDFYPEGRYQKGSKEYRKARDRAIAACTLCPVREECLDYALTNDIRSGIWGGETYSGRRKIRYPKKSTIAAAAAASTAVMLRFMSPILEAVTRATDLT